jgi:hypothetical protein
MLKQKQAWPGWPNLTVDAKLVACSGGAVTHSHDEPNAFRHHESDVSSAPASSSRRLSMRRTGSKRMTSAYAHRQRRWAPQSVRPATLAPRSRYFRSMAVRRTLFFKSPSIPLPIGIISVFGNSLSPIPEGRCGSAPLPTTSLSQKRGPERSGLTGLIRTSTASAIGSRQTFYS